jgi:hypothetical protein
MYFSRKAEKERRTGVDFHQLLQEVEANAPDGWSYE